jgi:centromere protein S
MYIDPSFSSSPTSILVRKANTQTANVATDLESFSRHAGRTTVTTDDVLLVTRRNDALHDIMKDFVDKEKAKNEKGKGKGRGRAKK